MAGNGWAVPAVDMYQTDNEVVVKAALPGMKAEDVQLNVTGEVLTIKGEIKQKEEVKEKAYHLREQRWGMFERSVILPTEVVADKAKADFENGILTIAIPKAEEANNHFGIKCKNYWTGKTYYYKDDDFNRKGQLIMAVT